jgi:hypothetical protein
MAMIIIHIAPYIEMYLLGWAIGEITQWAWESYHD